MNFVPLHSMTVTALAVLCLLFPAVLKAEVIYASHFEDDVHQLRGWQVTETSGSSKVTVRRLEPGESKGAAKDHSAALVIRAEDLPEPLRIAQVENLFRLEPGVSYELRATFRIPNLDPKRGGRVRIMVTDLRWTWSSPSLAFSEPQGEWRTVSIPFSLPESQSAGNFRIRLDALKVRVEMEIAEIAIVAVRR